MTQHKNPTPVQIATVAASLLGKIPSEHEMTGAIEAARRLLELSAAPPPSLPEGHIETEKVADYLSRNWRAQFSKLIAKLWDVKLEPDAATPRHPHDLVRYDKLPHGSFQTPQEFIQYHHARGWEPWMAALIRDLRRRSNRDAAKRNPVKKNRRHDLPRSDRGKKR